MDTLNSARIARVHARQVLDSRGRPTVEADVVLTDGSLGRACAPSGASTGRHEACELRDGDPLEYEGLGVRKAVDHANINLAPELVGHDATDQRHIDTLMRELDGTPSLERLGANAILAISLATARAGATHLRLPLYQHIAALANCSAISMPMPMTNILSGGAHAGRGMDLQDFLAMPVGAADYTEALLMISKVRSAAAVLMKEQGLSILLADEGGVSPGFSKAEQAMDLMVRAFEAAGLRPGEDVAIALDVAASELFSDGTYRLASEGKSLNGAEMVSFLGDLIQRYPVVSIEDPLDQDDWTHWHQFTQSHGSVQIVGDDLFVTNPERIERGISGNVANGVLIKVNQNGTLSGTIDAMMKARSAGYATIVSARSGETEDPFIADLAVGTNAAQIKIGSVRNSERLSKYNQLLRIEQEANLPFSGFVVPTPARRLVAA